MMKRHLGLFLILTMLLFFIPAAGASFGMRPYIAGSFGVNLCHPTAAYLEKYPGDESVRTPFFRTSSCFAIDAQLLEAAVSFGNSTGESSGNGSAGGISDGPGITFGAGISFLSVSQSKPWGRSILKPYYGLGLSFDLAYHFNSRFSVTAKYRYLYCTFTGSSASFIAHDLELAPAYIVAVPWAVDLAVTLPLTVSLKADSLSFRAALGVQIALDSRRAGGNP